MVKNDANMTCQLLNFEIENQLFNFGQTRRWEVLGSFYQMTDHQFQHQAVFQILAFQLAALITSDKKSYQ